MAQIITVDSELKGQRLDKVTAETLPTLSRAFVQRLIEEGRITLNDNIVKSGYRLRIDDVISIKFNVDELEQIDDIDLPIIYEDDHVFVINKPIGVISHSRGKYWYESSVASFVRQITGQDGDRAGIVHRLDRATSGVMICAKDNETMRFLQKQFGLRNVKKTYAAVVNGRMDPEEALIDMPIERNPKIPASFRVGSNGKASQTHYITVRTSNKYSLLELRPVTGRTHQLRVHLQHLGHSIVGDTLYKGQVSDRLYLHAHKLEITLPGGERKVFEAPIPPEFMELIENDS